MTWLLNKAKTLLATDVFSRSDAGRHSHKTLQNICVFVTFVLALPLWGGEEAVLDRFGGLKNLSFGTNSVFRTHFDGERWWLVTPDGGAFLSLGVCGVHPYGDKEQETKLYPYQENILARYGSVEAWETVATNRLRSWGFNSFGYGKLSRNIPYTKQLHLTSGLWKNLSAGGLKNKKIFPDFFDPEVRSHIEKRAQRAANTAKDPYLIGYFLGNELPWAKDWRLGPDIFPGYVALPSSAPGKQRLVEFMRERYTVIDKFNDAWSVDLKDWNELLSLAELEPVDSAKTRSDQEDFVLLVARKFFKTATDAVRLHDPNHLILGCRFFWPINPRPVVQACGEYCDVVSINYYEAAPFGKLALWLTTDMRTRTDLSFRSFHSLSKKPLLITEFSFKAMDSGLPNSYPPYAFLQPRVSTQKDRADKFEQCAVTWMEQPYFVGYHWFKYMDQPQGGRRSDGENNNFGLVNIHDEPYAALVERCAIVNSNVWRIHAESRLWSEQSNRDIIALDWGEMPRPIAFVFNNFASIARISMMVYLVVLCLCLVGLAYYIYRIRR